jgi:FMN phosphatase YigB (HAD superfamily)
VGCECNSQTLFVVFDLDGCLVDTRDLVEQAYYAAGVTMPPEAWGQPWQAWLPTALSGTGGLVEAVRRAKSANYLRLLKESAPGLLPPWEAFMSYRASEHSDVRIMSGAGLPAVEALLRHIGGKMEHVLGWEMTVEKKAEVLNSLPKPNRQVVYIDDHDDVRPLLRRNVIMVQYTDQTPEQLMEEVWTLSSLPQDATRG